MDRKKRKALKKGVKMSDLSKLLFNEIDEKLSELSRKGVGFIDCVATDCIEYQIDGRIFEIKITEKERS